LAQVVAARAQASGVKIRLATSKRPVAIVMEGMPSCCASRIKIAAVEATKIPPARTRKGTKRCLLIENVMW
jgi:hypothetical protein